MLLGLKLGSLFTLILKKHCQYFTQLAAKDPKFLDIIHDFDLWARPEQFIDWVQDTVLMNLGRGSGKNKAASALIVKEAIENPNSRIAVWAQSYKTLKDNNWAGESGILKAIHPSLLKRCNFNKSSLSLELPNGSIISSVSAESYESSRGQNTSFIVADELCAWTYASEALEAARLTLRLGENPRLLVTTTPKPTAVIKTLANDPDVHVMTGTTYQNYFLPDSYVKTLEKNLTERMRRQELLAEILDDNIYAMFKLKDIIDMRAKSDDFDYSIIKQFCVSIDPAVTSNEKSDLTGIVVVGVSYDGEYYIFEDASMDRASPEQWAKKVISTYKKYNQYEGSVHIVAEVNNGGELVKSVIQNAARQEAGLNLPPVKMVRASKGKEIRAEPVAALYEQGIVHHVGEHYDLELEMTDWNPTDKGAKSPDRMDALVWGVTSLSKGMVGSITSGYGTTTKTNDMKQGKYTNPYCGYY